MKKLSLLWLVSLIGVAPLYAAQIPAGTSLAAQQVFRYNNHSEPGTLDPQKIEENTAAQVAIDLFEGLVWLDSNGKVQPAQAESWKISADGKKVVFTLRNNLRWSDGSPLTADDFVFAWQRAVDPATASPFANYLASAHVVNAAQIASGKMPPQKLGVQAIDARTFQVELEQSTPWFISMLAWPTTFPVPHNVVQQYGEKWTSPEHIISNGAFVLGNRVVNEKIIAKPNPQYWNHAETVLTQVEYLVVDNAASGYNRYRAGDLDLTWVPADQIKNIQQSLPGELHIIPRLNTEYYNFNTEKPPFNDVRVRRALYLTVDRDLIARKVPGLREPASTLTQPQVADFKPPVLDELNKPLAQRTLLAQELLRQAGYNEQHPLQFELFYNKYDLHEKTAIALSSEWNKLLGAQITLRSMEWKTYLDARRAGEFMLSRQSWDATYNEPSTFLNTLQSTNAENVGHWKDAEYDRLLKQAESVADPLTRNVLYSQAEIRINQQAPVIPVYYQPLIKLLKPYVGGFPMNNPQDYVYSKELYIRTH